MHEARALDAYGNRIITLRPSWTRGNDPSFHKAVEQRQVTTRGQIG